MAELLKVKLREVGTSIGLLLPRDQLQQAHLSVNDEVEVALLPHQKDFSGFGIAQRFKVHFRRSKKDRKFS